MENLETLTKKAEEMEKQLKELKSEIKRAKKISGDAITL